MLLLSMVIAPIVLVADGHQRPMALELYRNARQSHKLGDTESADILLKKAKALKSEAGLKKSWVIKKAATGQATQPNFAADLLTLDRGHELLFKYLASPTKQGQLLMEAYLKKFPEQTEIRQKYQQKAALSGHLSDTRHIQDMNSETFSGLTLHDLKVFFAIMVFLLLIWQTIILINEYNNKSER